MSCVPFDELSSSARLWTFALERKLTPSESAQLLTRLRDFLEQWSAHKVDVRAGVTLEDDQFILVGADSDTSGCSIDALVSAVSGNAEELKCALVSSRLVLAIVGDVVTSYERPKFRSALSSGELSEASVVIDLTHKTVGEYRELSLKRPLQESWHGQAFLT